MPFEKKNKGGKIYRGDVRQQTSEHSLSHLESDSKADASSPMTPNRPSDEESVGGRGIDTKKTREVESFLGSCGEKKRKRGEPNGRKALRRRAIAMRKAKRSVVAREHRGTEGEKKHLRALRREESTALTWKRVCGSSLREKVWCRRKTEADSSSLKKGSGVQVGGGSSFECELWEKKQFRI